MTPFTPALERAAQICALCHDQCVSACPVVDTTRDMAAYPSRLATLAWELARGNVRPDPCVARALQQCIGCNACTASCVYLDSPNDVTPVVRWARRALVEQGQATPAAQAMLARIRTEGTPFGRVDALLERLAGQVQGGPRSDVWLYVDAATLSLAPHMATAAVELLRRLGCQRIAVAKEIYAGDDLWRYGFADQFRDVARAVADEIEQTAPDTVIALSPAATYLFRHTFPNELGIHIKPQVLTLAEAVACEVYSHRAHFAQRPESVYLVSSDTEVYRSGEEAARSIVERCCTSLAPGLGAFYPEGVVLDVAPDPRATIGERLTAQIHAGQITDVVATHAAAWQALREVASPARLHDLASYLVERLADAEAPAAAPE